MKKIFYIITLATLAFACNKLEKNEYLVSGVADGIENGKKIYIEIQDEAGPITKDTAVIENGKFEFKGKFESIELAFIKIENENGQLPFILEEGKINITYATDSLFKSKVSGTMNNDKLQFYNNESNNISKKLAKFQQQNSERMKAAKTAQDTATINMIMKEYSSYQTSLNDVSKNFIKDNPKAFLSVLLVENFLMRQYLTNEEIKEYFSKLDPSLLKTKSGLNIKNTLDSFENIQIGNKAPDFSAKNPEGKEISLKESLGKVTIIDFWASWCGPCRAENPNVVALYNQYHEKGLNIIGVSLDKDAVKWKEAIAKDGLTWNHISNLKFWKEPIAELYNVKSIPATFILDANGNIIAKDLRGDALKAKVEELLAK
ncbi:TlpA disulfide reductase family protein [Flavobacterium sp.]|jgi:peroxiredoxin|uniref:TlpA disulfide reductase family protein n=1 Tax=Flavobacterium sp. TaxID=239 RepID=UPI002A82ADBD|nr:TlpA disulfide reductase family protein [Flavobacterium sp.]